ncbi:MAG: zinc-binding dehydrogenase, partial [Alphaproteobacteria bacterium]
KTTFFNCRRLLRAGGTFAATDLGPWGQTLLLAFWSTLTRSRRVAIPMPSNSEAFVDFLKARIEAGDFRAVIDRRYPLEEIVDAYRFVESERKTGIVVINVVPANESKLA